MNTRQGDIRRSGTYMVIMAYEGVMMKDWKEMTEGWCASPSERTTFISFHLRGSTVSTVRLLG